MRSTLALSLFFLTAVVAVSATMSPAAGPTCPAAATDNLDTVAYSNLREKSTTVSTRSQHAHKRVKSAIHSMIKKALTKSTGAWCTTCYSVQEEIEDTFQLVEADDQEAEIANIQTMTTSLCPEMESVYHESVDCDEYNQDFEAADTTLLAEELNEKYDFCANTDQEAATADMSVCTTTSMMLQLAKHGLGKKIARAFKGQQRAQLKTLARKGRAAKQLRSNVAVQGDACYNEGVACTTDSECCGDCDEEGTCGENCHPADATVLAVVPCTYSQDKNYTGPMPPASSPVSTRSSMQRRCTATRRMDQLAIGDLVQVQPSADDNNDDPYLFEPIIAFSHRDGSSTASYLQLWTTSSARPLEIASGHYLYLANPLRKVLPEDVRLGDELAGGGRVVRVLHVEKEGVFHPHTPSAKLIVNGFLTSTNTAYIDEIIMDNVVTPLAQVMANVGMPFDLAPDSRLWRGDQFIKATKQLQDEIRTRVERYIPPSAHIFFALVFGSLFFMAVLIYSFFGEVALCLVAAFLITSLRSASKKSC